MCGKSFSRSNNLKIHIDLNHKQINEFQCEYCEETFGRKLNLDKHLNKYCHIKFNTSFNCTKCFKSFKTKQALSSHKKTHESIESISDKKCNICDKVMSRAKDLKRHMKTHSVFVNNGSMMFVVEHGLKSLNPRVRSAFGNVLDQSRSVGPPSTP